MHKKIIEQEARCRQDQANDEYVLALHHSDKESKADAQLPRKEERALARTSLAMLRQLNEKQEETAADDADAKAYHRWGNV